MTSQPEPLTFQKTILGKYLVGASFRKAKGTKGRLPEAKTWRVLTKEGHENAEERAQTLASKFRKEADEEMNQGILMGPKTKKSVKMVGILARIKARKTYRSEAPRTGLTKAKSQKSKVKR